MSLQTRPPRKFEITVHFDLTYDGVVHLVAAGPPRPLGAIDAQHPNPEPGDKITWKCPGLPGHYKLDIGEFFDLTHNQAEDPMTLPTYVVEPGNNDPEGEVKAGAVDATYRYHISLVDKPKLATVLRERIADPRFTPHLATLLANVTNLAVLADDDVLALHYAIAPMMMLRESDSELYPDVQVGTGG